MRRFIIDTDTSSVDAVSIMMALASPDIKVEALTIVAGNVPVAQGSINARYTLEICSDTIGQHVPVYEGCDRPFMRDPYRAEWFNGNDGMSNLHYSMPRIAAEPGHAVPELVARFEASPGEIELITLGPLTNIAAALAVEPRLADWVQHCYIMGGAVHGQGNITPVAEYNFWSDPESAQRVLQSGMDITLLGWDLSCGEAALSDAEMAEIKALDTARAQMTLDANGMALRAMRNLQGNETGLTLAEPLAMAVAIDPDIAVQSQLLPVHVETSGEHTRGMCVIDRDDLADNRANATVCFAIDIQRWKNLLKSSLACRRLEYS